MSNAESVIFNSDSLEFRGSLSRTSWIQSLCDTGKKVFKYNHSDYNFDKEIIDLLRGRGFIHSSVRLDKIHEELSTDDMTVDVNQINNIVKTCYETNERIGNLYHEFIRKCVKPIMDDQIYFQKTPTFRFSFPKSIGMTKRDYHNDIMLGHPPEELNIWAPFTNSSQSKSFVILPLDKSLYLLKKFDYNLQSLHQAIWKDNKIKQFCDDNTDIVSLDKDEFLIFDSRCLHAAILNESEYTRVSMDIRIIRVNEYNNLPFTYIGTGRRKAKFTPDDYYHQNEI